MQAGVFMNILQSYSGTGYFCKAFLKYCDCSETEGHSQRLGAFTDTPSLSLDWGALVARLKSPWKLKRYLPLAEEKEPA